MSKIRLRNIDVENITMISRLAKIVEEVPLNQLITILNGDRHNLQKGQGHGIPGIHSLLEAFMFQRDEWSALIAAEWRLLNGKTSSVRLMVRLLSLATDQEAPPDLNTESDLDNEEEESY